MSGKRPTKRAGRRPRSAAMVPGTTAAAQTRRPWLRVVVITGAAVLVTAIAAAFLLFRGAGEASRKEPPVASAYVGGAICAGCHPAEAAAWRGSHHALAMGKAGGDTVLGDFNDACFTYYGVTSRFFRRDDRFFVNTDGPDGRMADFEISYTFGVFPLQQYLVQFPDGRLQALSIAWDARTKEAGGQRWFHLYPDEPIRHGDALHWTGPNQNWNYMCAECHATEVHKNYDAATDQFRTTWSELSVSCEACHGPASRHVAWAEHRGDWWRIDGTRGPDKGLPVIFNERAGVVWSTEERSGEVRRSALQPQRLELETCGRCHARRVELSEDWLPGRPLSDTHVVSLLERGLYHADGQIDGEVYEYGSFRQSRMFAGGVTCSDCHNPHNLALRATGDGLCLQCHSTSTYAAPKHSHHEAASEPLACTSCHMPARTYMSVHVRHDHSFRVPRPDLSKTLGTPNACNDCHKERSPDWAADAIERWYGPTRKGFQNFAAALHAARREQADAPDLLEHVASDPQTPPIARATALEEMGPYLSPKLRDELRRGLSDQDPLVRIGALHGLAGLSPDQRWPLANWLLSDPVLAVRAEAVSFLVDAAMDRRSPEERERFEIAAQEYVNVQRLNADRPEARVTLGAFFARRRQVEQAEAEYRAAIALSPRFVEAYVNLADLYRQLGRDKDGEPLLQQVLAIAPDDAAAQHAWGLQLARQQRLSEAVSALGKAAALDPSVARYAYVYAIALKSVGRRKDALHVLQESCVRHPADHDTLSMLIGLERDAGDRAAALRYAEALDRLAPGNPAVRQVVDELRNAGAR